MKIDQNKIKTDRVNFDGLGNFYPADGTVKVTRQLVAGVTCYWFVPERYDDGRIIIHLHGGLFGLGSLQSHTPMVSHLATTLSAKILFIEYSLAPEKPFPNALNDVMSVYREIIHQYPDTSVTLIGDSAGGGLSVSFIRNAEDEGIDLPTGVIMISPWLYLKCDTESHRARKTMDPILTRDMLVEYGKYYVADNKWNEADPGQLSFQSFPPLLIMVGSNEILFDDSRLLYEKIRQIQPATTFKVFPNQNHVWLMGDIASEGSKEALADMKEFIAKTTSVVLR